MRPGPRPTNTASSARASDIGNGFAVTEMVEKPRAGHAPSNYYINGRYILQPEIFEMLGTQERGAGNEIQLTDAHAAAVAGPGFFASPFEGRMFDCGSKDGFIQANVAFALARDDMRDLVSDRSRQ